MNYVIDNKEVEVLFPTTVFKGMLNDLSLCDSLEKSIRKLHRSKTGAYVTKDQFISYDNLHENEDFADLNKLVIQEASSVLDFYKIIRDDHYISAMWANITTQNHRHMFHIHPNSMLSGILYIKTPLKCGNIVFSDPRPAARMMEPDYTALTEMNAGSIQMVPTKGRMLFWPSWLPHGVEKGDNQGTDRIAIAFNVMIRGKATLPTNRMVWL